CILCLLHLLRRRKRWRRHKMHRLGLVAFFIGFLMLIPALSARAGSGDIVPAGTPDPAQLITDPPDNHFADIYVPQFAYTPEADKQSALLLTRQKNFAEPRDKAYHAWEGQVDSLYGSVEDSDGNQ